MPKAGDKRFDGYVWHQGSWRSPESVMRRKAYDRERQRRLYENEEYRKKKNEKRRGLKDRDPAKYAVLLEKKRQRYQENKEKENARRAEYARRNREASRDNAKRKYHESDGKYLATILRSRRRRIPSIGLYSIIRDFREGKILLDDAIRSIEQASTRLCESDGERHIDRCEQQHGSKGN